MLYHGEMIWLNGEAGYSLSYRTLRPDWQTEKIRRCPPPPLLPAGEVVAMLSTMPWSITRV